MVAISDTTSKGERLKDLVLNILGKVPEGRIKGQDAERRNLIPNNELKWPPAEWRPSPRKNYFVIQDPIIIANSLKLNFTNQDLIPNTDDFIFQTDLDVPKLIAVSWPKALNPKVTKKIPYLIYFRPKPNASSDRWGPSYTGASNLVSHVDNRVDFYPFGWDFLYYEFWNYLNYRCDPLTYWEERWRPSREFIRDAGPPGLRETNEKFSFGLPHQIAASGKPVVLVFPLLDVTRTLGQFFKASIVQETLEAIQAYVFQKAEIQAPFPPLSNVALAGYSFSVDFVRQFLQKNRNHPLVIESLKEVYLFDPSKYQDAGDKAIKAALDWASAGTASESKAIRLYSQQKFDRFSDLLGGAVTDSPFYRESRGNNKRSAALLPIRVWQEAQTAARRSFRVDSRRKIREHLRSATSGEEASNAFVENRKFFNAETEQNEYDRFNEIKNFFDVHYMIPAIMLTDALRRSDLI
jgi:hypothetical protein